MTFGVPRLNREKIELQRKLEEYKDEYEHMLDVEMPRWSYTYEEWNESTRVRKCLVAAKS